MKIIINSDDFGNSKKITMATIEAIRSGFCSSTTMLANGAYFNEAAELIRNSGLACSVGIHLNFTEGSPLTDRLRRYHRFCDQDGVFRKTNVFVKWLGCEERRLLADEFRAQIRALREAGIQISHADGHHHIHVRPATRFILTSVLKSNNITKVRLAQQMFPRFFGFRAAPQKVFNAYLKRHFITTDCFCGPMANYSQCREKLAHNGSCEIMIHAGYDEFGNVYDWVDQLPLVSPDKNHDLITYNDL